MFISGKMGVVSGGGCAPPRPGRYRFGKLRERGFPAANWVGVRADYIGNRALYITFTGVVQRVIS